MVHASGIVQNLISRIFDLVSFYLFFSQFHNSSFSFTILHSVSQFFSQFHNSSVSFTILQSDSQFFSQLHNSSVILGGPGWIWWSDGPGGPGLVLSGPGPGQPRTNQDQTPGPPGPTSGPTRTRTT